MIYKLHTEETVHGVYEVEAHDLTDLYDKFSRGEIGEPEIYEATDVKIDYAEPTNE